MEEASRIYRKLANASNYLSIGELHSGHTYLINARNSNVGIWLPEKEGFLIRRIKMERIYPFVEYHWDQGEPYGTVRPFKQVDQSPFALALLLELANMPFPDEHDDAATVLAYLHEIEERFPFPDAYREFAGE